METKAKMKPLPVSERIDPSEIEATVARINRGRANNFKAMPAMLAKGRGDPNCLRVFQSQGDSANVRELIDLHACFGAAGAGNGDPELSKLAAEFILQGTPIVPATIATEEADQALKALLGISGIRDGQVFFANDGCVAVEAAVRIAFNYHAKKYGLRLDGSDSAWNEQYIVVAENCYHGSVGLARSFLTAEIARTNFGPLMSNVLRVPFGDSDALETMLQKHPSKIAAVLLEPIQGAGGCIAPHSGYLEQVVRLCRLHDTLFIADEIKTGFGRAGKFFLTHRHDPDLICGGKSAAGGIVPLSFVIGKREIMSGFEPGTLGLTWVASPLQCTLMLAWIKRLQEILPEVRRKSVLLADLFEMLRTKYPKHILGFHGAGLMRSLETIFPGKDLAETVREFGVFTTPIERKPNRVYIAPALEIRDEQIRAVVEAFGLAIAKLAGQG